MEAAIIGVLVAACLFLLGRSMLGQLGIGRPDGKPDCGCGSCERKRRMKA